MPYLESCDFLLQVLSAQEYSFDSRKFAREFPVTAKQETFET